MPPQPSATDQHLRPTPYEQPIAERMRIRLVAQPRSASSGRWAGFTFNGITRCEKGSYALVGGVAEGFCEAVELSDAERDQLLALNRKPCSRH